MSKNLTIDQWKEVIHNCQQEGIYSATRLYLKITKNENYNLKDLRERIRRKTKLVENNGMEILKRKPGSGRPPKNKDRDIQDIIDDLNEEQKREIIESWIKEKRKKKNKDSLKSLKTLTPALKARILMMHRTTFYKVKKQRIYKYDYLKPEVIKIFQDSCNIYGSRKITVLLAQKGLFIDDRTLRNYMKRWGMITLTRKKRKVSEQKNTKTKFADLVKRNYNPQEDTIIATDVSYIPAKTEQNNLYLSVAISHKTKLVEAWKLSNENDTKLVVETITDLKRENFILHSNHGTQYSTQEVQNKLNEMKAKTSMSRVGNSLDNREVEYFFSCLKGEYLNHIKTKSMNYDEIYKEIKWYIDWYNSSRIQKVLNWKAPAFASAYV